jgi:hypothetical protein
VVYHSTAHCVEYFTLTPLSALDTKISTCDEDSLQWMLAELLPRISTRLTELDVIVNTHTVIHNSGTSAYEYDSNLSPRLRAYVEATRRCPLMVARRIIAAGLR